MSRKKNTSKSRGWFFTLDNPEEGEWNRLIQVFEEEHCDYVFQLEKARGGLRHFQGVVRYENPRANWPPVDCHWERCRNWRQAVKYCSKLDTRILGPWSNLENLRFRKTIRDPLLGRTIYPWQMRVLDLIKTEPNDRDIHWFWDSEGNTGKSSLAKHIVMNYEACLINGGTKDNLFAIKQRLDEDREVDIVLFDIPRSQFNDISYVTIECVKNGCFFSGKYESSQVLMNSPHLLVFCNFPPDLSKLSLDRWHISNISIN